MVYYDMNLILLFNLIRTMSCWCRAVVIWLVSVVYRFRYYFAWAISEAALIFSGFCFNGWAENGKRGGDAPDRARWDRCVNTRIRQVCHR